MTTYAYDPSTSTLLAIWEAGLGCSSHSVTRLHARTRSGSASGSRRH